MEWSLTSNAFYNYRMQRELLYCGKPQADEANPIKDGKSFLIGNQIVQRRWTKVSLVLGFVRREKTKTFWKDDIKWQKNSCRYTEEPKDKNVQYRKEFQAHSKIGDRSSHREITNWINQAAQVNIHYSLNDVIEKFASSDQKKRIRFERKKWNYLKEAAIGPPEYENINFECYNKAHENPYTWTQTWK